MLNDSIVAIMLPLFIHFLMWSGPVQCIYIHNITSQCLGSHCLTLSMISHISNESYLTGNDKAMIFEPGEHHLDLQLQISNSNSFSMIANTTSSSNSVVTIVCNRGVGFTFTGGHNIYMKGLNFVGCTGNKLEYVDQFTIEDSKFIGNKRNPIQPYTLGSIFNIFRSTSVKFIHTSFENNEYGTEQRAVFLFYDPHAYGYGIATKDLELGGAIHAKESQLEFVECLFENNKAGLGGALYVSNSSKITIIKSSFLGNFANFFYPGKQFEHDVISLRGDLGTRTVGTGGGAILADQTSIIIANSSFIGNTAQYGGAVRFIAKSRTITITESEFIDNTAHDGGGAMWWTSSNSTISITNNSFVSNIALTKYGGGALKAAITFDTITTISANTFSNNLASNNSGGVISICNSNSSAITIISYNNFYKQSCQQKRRSFEFLE